MKNRYFFIVVLISIAGIITAIIELNEGINKHKSSCPGVSIPMELYQNSQEESLGDFENQQIPFIPELIQQDNQNQSNGNYIPLGDGTFDIMSIPDPQLRALLSDNMNIEGSKPSDNREDKQAKSEVFSKPLELYTGEERTFGFLPQNPAQNPADEFFYLEVQQPLTSQTEVYLEYDLYGVEDNTQVSRSINEQPVFGGYVVKQHNGWSKQSEQINPELLRQGINTIRFSITEDAKYSYRVKNLRFRIAESETEIEGDSGRKLIINQPTANYYNQHGFVHGFVVGEGSDKAKIRIAGQKVRSYKGEFESLINRKFQGEKESDDVHSSQTTWSVPVEVVFADGEILSTEIRFENPAQWDYATSFDPDIYFMEKEIEQDADFMLTLGTATLQGEAGSLEESTNISITALRAIDLPKLNPGMVNVTAKYDGYRFLPHGSNFEKPLDVTIGFDSTKLPRGHNPQEIRTYYYDESRSHWVALPRDSVNKEDYLVCSRTTHFTDMINAIVKVPEMPETQEFTPTSLKELQAADPSSGIQMMQPPTANSQGTASLSYPINVPAGRQGLQPNLAVSYSSEAANGLLGMGWDMQIPAITVDNKWGVPRYDERKETETYLYNGEELLPSARLDGFVNDRPFSNEKQFYPRVESGFEKIIRKGDGTKNYFWIVTDKQGTQYYYGTYDGEGCYDSVLLKDASGNIAHWPLCKVIDVNGNHIQYCYKIREQRSEYQASYPLTSPLPGSSIYLGKQLWLESISYTGFEDETGAYKVVFSSTNYSLDEAREVGCEVLGHVAPIGRSSGGTLDDSLSKGTNNTMSKGRGVPDNIIWEDVPGSEEPEEPPVEEPNDTCSVGTIRVQVCMSPCGTPDWDGAFVSLGTDAPVFQDMQNPYNDSPFPVQFIPSDNPNYTNATPMSGITTSDPNGCFEMMICPNVTYYLVAISPSICREEPIHFPFRVNDFGVVTIGNTVMGKENGLPTIGEEVTSTVVNGDIFFNIPIECDCSNPGGYCYDCWEPCNPYCPSVRRQKVYIGVQDNFCAHDRLPLCNFELVCEADPYQKVYKYTTGYTKIQPVDVRCEEWYKVTGTYFGANYQNTNIEFGFMIDNNRQVYIKNEYGILSHINPQIIVNTYNGGDVIEMLMPVVPKPKQVKLQIVDDNNQGVPNYTFLLGNITTGDVIEGVYTTDFQGYTPEIPLMEGNIYYIGEVDITAYGNIIGHAPYSDYVANWQNKIELYIWVNKCALQIGRESGSSTPNISCSSGRCTFTYTEEPRIMSKDIRIRKIASDGELIGEAVFHLDDGEDYITNGEGLTKDITITNGQTYTIRETSVPFGFLLDNRVINISMNNTGFITIHSQVAYSFDRVNNILTITNKRGCEGTSFMIKKEDASTGEPLYGALIKYYKNDDHYNALDIFYTDDLGRTHIRKLECGETYYIKEEAVPSGYKSEYPAFAVVKADSGGNITIIDSAQLSGLNQVDGVWVFTFVNYKKDNHPDTIPEPPGACRTTYAYDNTINTRNGFRQSSKEKLSKIIVFYKDSCVRTYTFCYETDFFGRARLEAINQWGSEDTLEAYTHTFTYYNDAGSHQNLLQAPVTMTAPEHDSDNDQNKKIAKKLRNMFLKNMVSPSILGGSRTWSIGLNTGADIGLFPAFPLKTLSGGLYLNGSMSFSKGKTTMLDINGDGLPDRVYNVMEGLKNKTYYCEQLPNREGFGEPKLLDKVGVFLEDFSDNASIGLQASAFFHGGIQKGFVGNSWTNIYFADMDGDGFADLVSSSGVLNLGTYQPPPLFNFGDCLPPEITQIKDSLVVKCDTNFSFTKEVYERDRTNELRYDLVRVWQADMSPSNLLSDLTYSICAPVHLAYDSIALENFCGHPDSVIVSIEYYGTGLTGREEHLLLWSDVIGDSDTTEHGLDFCDLTVNTDPDTSCPIMLRKVFNYDKPLGNVVFTLDDGTELVTNASNGLTPAFYIEQGISCIDVTETTTLTHCHVLQQPFSICKNDSECTIIVQGMAFVTKEWIDGREVHVVTIINDCNQKDMCFARIKKVNQYGNPLEGVTFELQKNTPIPGRTVTTNAQGYTPIISIFENSCAEIMEISTLSQCNLLQNPIQLCAGRNCNMNVAGFPIQSEWINGMLIHTITITNECPDMGEADANAKSSMAKSVRGSSSKTAFVNNDFDLSKLKLNPGDKLFFRVRPQNNGVKKKVVWNPAVLPYSRSLSRTAYLDENGRIFGGGNKASESQLLQGDSMFFCPADGEITIESVINPFPPLTDSVRFEIWKDNSLIYLQTILAGQSMVNAISFEDVFAVDTSNKFKFKVVCKSNVNMHEIQWYPRIYYNFLNHGNEVIEAVIKDDDSNDVRMLEYVIAPYHDFYHHITNLQHISLNKVHNTPPTLGVVRRQISRIRINSFQDGKAYIGSVINNL